MPDGGGKNHKGLPAAGEIRHPYCGPSVQRSSGGRHFAGGLLPKFAEIGAGERCPHYRFPGNLNGRVWIPGEGGYKGRRGHGEKVASG